MYRIVSQSAKVRVPCGFDGLADVGVFMWGSAQVDFTSFSSSLDFTLLDHWTSLT